MKMKFLFILALLSVGIGILSLRSYDSHLPSEKKVIAAARLIEEFVELEQNHGLLDVAVGSGVRKFHTGNHGGADIIGVENGRISWSYYPANGEVIITRITLGDTTVYEEDREPGEGGNSE